MQRIRGFGDYALYKSTFYSLTYCTKQQKFDSQKVHTVKEIKIILSPSIVAMTLSCTIFEVFIF